MTRNVTSNNIIEAAKKHEIREHRNPSSYFSSVESEIWTSGFSSIKKVSMGFSKMGKPIFAYDKKNRKVPYGESFIFNAPNIGQGEVGYVVQEMFNMKIQITIFQMKRKLYLSSYSFHFELLQDRNKFFRYEKSEYVAEEDMEYKPEFHMHCMGRLSHYPAHKVTIGQLLKNLKANIFNSDNYGKLDPPWGSIFS